jgi:alkaline phosphatase D
MKRRDFLKTVALAGFAGPALWSQSGCAPTLLAPASKTGLLLSYVSGDVTSDSAMIWLRAEPGSEVSLQYGKAPALESAQMTQPYPVGADADFTAKIGLENLEPATRYYYRASVTGKTPGAVASFVTAPAPDAEAKVSFCFSGDSRDSYLPFSVMDAVRAQRPDFFLHLGDTIYADRNSSAHQLAEFWAKYRVNREDLASQYCFRDTSVYAVWDDHEVADNYLPTHPLASIGQKAFLDYWPIRPFVAEPQRIYRSFRWGKAAELFLLDTRQYRDPKRMTMLGKLQKAWLLENLARSSAMVKFIASSVPFAGGGSDRWDGYPQERSEILRYINTKKISGVVFLSADLHYAAITKIPKSGGIKDITAGPLAAPLNRISNGTARRYEFFLAENFNFAKITVDPKAEPGKVSVEFIDQDNRVFHSTKLKVGITPATA